MAAAGRLAAAAALVPTFLFAAEVHVDGVLALETLLLLLPVPVLLQLLLLSVCHCSYLMH